MDKLEYLIEKEFQSIIKSNHEHKFLNDMKLVTKKEKKYLKQQIKISKNYQIKCQKNQTIENIKIVEEKKDTVNKNFIKNIYLMLQKNTIKWETIKSSLEELSNKNLLSTIKSSKKLFNKMKNKKDNEINILIVGLGPSGLFMCNYLNKYYNQSSSSIKVNIIGLENRIVKEGLKKPYDRNRYFSFRSIHLSYLFRFISCWNHQDRDYYLTYVKMLENLLYVLAFVNDIPMMYTKKFSKWTDIKKLSKELKIDILFDSTGHRLNPPIFSKIKNWLTENKTENSLYKIDISKKNNLAVLKWKKSFPKNKYYISLQTIKCNKPIHYSDIVISNKADLELGKEFHNKFITEEYIFKFISKLTNTTSRNFLNSYLKHTTVEKRLFKINLIEIFIYHKLKICQKFDNTLYIGTGDTIFHSHFITGAGINRTMDFIVKTIGFIPILKS
jgi:hypothetical protein